MKAIQVKEFGGRENLFLGNYKTPTPSENQILIKVKAAGINRADILQREGKYPPPKGESEILGLEVAGIVTEVGPDVTRWKEGDTVFGLLPGGGYAQFAVIHEDMAMSKPEHLSFESAAAIPEAFITAYQALIWLAKLKPGETVLVHAGGSGVGTAAIQLIKQIGAECIITSSAPKHKICSSLGAFRCIDYKTENFVEIIQTELGGVDVIIDFLGASYFSDNLKCLNSDGRMVMLAFMGGVKLPNLKLAPIVLKRLSILGSTLRSRDIGYQIKLVQSFWKLTKPQFENKLLNPVLDRVYNWSEVQNAHLYMEENKNKGKIVLTID